MIDRNRLWRQIHIWWEHETANYQSRQEKIKAEMETTPDRLTIGRALSIFLDTFGLGSRNVFYTAAHLFWRPGYMINDYVNGRRKRYLQPFMMFFLLTLILVQVAWIRDVQLPKNKAVTLSTFELIREHKTFFTPKRKTIALNIAGHIDAFHQWRDKNRSYDVLMRSIWMMLITWLLWRKTPRVGGEEWAVSIGEQIEGYNLAEIITLIVYILCQVQILSIVWMLCFGTLLFEQSGWMMIIPTVLWFALLAVDFKQFFQLSWKATLWRTAIVVIFV